MVAGDRLEAQVTGSWLDVGFALERTDRRDHRASPARYAGFSQGWAMGFERRTRSAITRALVEYTGGDLSSDLTGGKERLRRGIADLSVQRRLRSNLFVGLGFAVRADNAEHTYPLSNFGENFELIRATVSPVVTWTPWWRGRPIDVRASVAAVSLVDHEYTRNKAGATKAVTAGPTRFAAGSLEASRMLRDRKRVAWRVAATTTAWRHRTDDAIAALETRASLTGRLRLGGMK